MNGDRVLPPGTVLPPVALSPPNFNAEAVEAAAKPAPSPCRGSPGAARSNAGQGGGACQPGRFQVLNDFVDVSMRQISDRAFRAWLVLYRDTKPNGTAATGLTDIARRAGYSHKTARRAVNDLIKSGLARRIGRGGKGKGPNVYRVVGAAKNAPEAE